MTVNETYSVTSRFDIACTNWVDPEDLGLANYVYKYDQTNDKGEMIRSTLASTKRSSIPAILPIGEKEVIVLICDVLDACTEVTVGVTEVEMPTYEDFTSYDPMKLVKEYMESGDQLMLGMLINAYNSVMANASWAQLDANATDGLTTEELNNLLLVMSNATAEQISAMTTAPTPTSVSGVNVVMKSLTSALGGITKSENAAYTLTLQTREDVMGVLRQMTNAIETVDVASPQQLEPFLSGSLDVMTAMMISGNVVMKNGDKAPPGDMLVAGDAYYDSAIQDDLDAVVPTDEYDLLTQAVMENSGRTIKDHTNEMLEMIQNISNVVYQKQVKVF